jgi:hypothetical protein
MSTAEKIYDKAKTLPEPAQAALLKIVEMLAAPNGQNSFASPSLTPEEAAELRGKLVAWEEDWNAPGMEAYDKP